MVPFTTWSGKNQRKLVLTLFSLKMIVVDVEEEEFFLPNML